MGRDPRKRQGEIPGGEQSAPELGAIPGQTETRKESPKSGTHIQNVIQWSVPCGRLSVLPKAKRYIIIVDVPMSYEYDVTRMCYFEYDG